MTEELDGGGPKIVVQDRKEGGLGVHRNVPNEFAVCNHAVSLGCSRYVFCLAR